MKTTIPATKTEYYRNVEKQLDIDITLAAQKLTPTRLHKLPDVLYQFDSIDPSYDFIDVFFNEKGIELLFSNPQNQGFYFGLDDIGLSDKVNLLEALEKLEIK